MKFLVADYHFDDEDVVTKMCRGGFTDIKQHNEHLLDRTNSKVGRGDQLFIVGDMGRRPQKFRQEIRCKNVWCILGNHDTPGQIIRAFGEQKVRTRHQIRIGDDGAKCILDHHPGCFWHGSHHGFYHAYGHCHWQREKTMSIWMPQRRSFDVGVDNLKKVFDDFAPISEYEFLDVLKDRKGMTQLSFTSCCKPVS